jgi:hypothetical protein
LDVPTRSSSAGPVGNLPAISSLLVGILGVLAVPLGVAAAWRSDRVDLVQGTAVGAIAAFLLGLVALALARRGIARVQRTLGRSGWERTARVARWLAFVSLWAAVTAGLALGFYALLELFAR